MKQRRCDVCMQQAPDLMTLIVKNVPVRGGAMHQTFRFKVCSLRCGAVELERRGRARIGAEVRPS